MHHAGMDMVGHPGLEGHNVSRYYILDADHNPVPVDMLEWGRWFEDLENRVVKQDDINGIRVSTVCLGMDHNFAGGEPHIFETMCFDRREDKDSYAGEYQERCSTWAEALEEHAKAVAWAKEQK